VPVALALSLTILHDDCCAPAQVAPLQHHARAGWLCPPRAGAGERRKLWVAQREQIKRCSVLGVQVSGRTKELTNTQTGRDVSELTHG